MTFNTILCISRHIRTRRYETAWPMLAVSPSSLTLCYCLNRSRFRNKEKTVNYHVTKTYKYVQINQLDSVTYSKKELSNTCADGFVVWSSLTWTCQPAVNVSVETRDSPILLFVYSILFGSYDTGLCVKALTCNDSITYTVKHFGG